MRASDIRDLATEDIQGRIGELEEERFRLRFRSGSEELTNPLRLREIRKDIARMKTIMHQRKLEGGSTAGSAGRTR